MRAFTIALCLLATPALVDVTGPVGVIDGDALEVRGERIRLHGIDAPEERQTCWDDRGEFPCGQRASFFLEVAVKGQSRTRSTRSFEASKGFDRGSVIALQAKPTSVD